MARTTRRGKSAIKFNFEKVGARFTHEGKYILECISCKMQDGDKASYLSCQWKAIEAITGNEKSINGILYDNLSLSENALWKSKLILDAAGYDFPEDDDFDMSEEDFIGLTIMADVEMLPYTNKDGGKSTSPSIDADSIEPAPKKSRKAKDEDEKPSRRSKADDEDEKPTRGRRSRKADAEDGEEEIGPKAGNSRTRRAKDDDEDEKPARKKSYAEDDVLGMDEDKLQVVIEKAKLDIDLEDYKSIRQMRNAVIDALEAEELLDA